MNNCPRCVEAYNKLSPMEKASVSAIICEQCDPRSFRGPSPQESKIKELERRVTALESEVQYLKVFDRRDSNE